MSGQTKLNEIVPHSFQTVAVFYIIV